MKRIVPIEKDLLIMVPKTYSSTEKGSFFEKICSNILKKQSYEIIHLEVRKTGMEIDIEAIHTPSKKTVYVECKFYHTQKINANVVDLCFSQAFRNKSKAIALFSTTPLGKDAQGAYEQYRDDTDLDFAFYGKTEILEALIVSGQIENIDNLNIGQNVRHATLLIHPEISSVWLFQVIEDGIPQKVLYYTSDNNLTSQRIRDILDSQNVLEGLEIEKFNKASDSITTKSQKAPPKEVVSKILLADDIMDYKPCRPENFVGRETIQKEIWDYLEDVRLNNTDYRLLSIVGPSGNGKSSLVAKLSERFKNVKWKKKFYMYPVDVRSARGANFIIEALAKAFSSAITDNFIKLNETFTIENANEITSNTSFKKCSKYLEENNRVLVLFFDQFEEVFMKEELFGLFKSFERTAIDISSEHTNFVLGFSWRSGITLGEENPAYSMWNKLRDFRVDKKLSDFEFKDSSKMVSSFEKNTGINLMNSLKKRSIQQSQGLPWFLKKLCIHIYKKNKEGFTQEELLINQFQIKDLFDDDLDRPDKERECLKFIANNSPIDQYEVTRDFGHNTLQNLITDRLVIKTGEKLSVYWDVFRDYLRTDKAPIIPWTFMPTYSITLSIKLLEHIDNGIEYSTETIATKTGYSIGTINNAMIDLQSTSIIKKHNNMYKLIIDKKLIPETIRTHFLGHIIYLKILEKSQNEKDKYISKEYFITLVNKYFSNTAKNLPTSYINKMISWLKYTGLCSFTNSKVLVYNDDEFSPEYASDKNRSYLFLGGSSPEKAIKAIEIIKSNGYISEEKQIELKARNTVSDLITLGICIRDNNSKVCFNRNIDISNDSLKILCSAIVQTETIVLLHKYLPNYKSDKIELSKKIESEIGKEWKKSSRNRNITSLIKFYNFSKKNRYFVNE